jgi:hypothetical protein
MGVRLSNIPDYQTVLQFLQVTVWVHFQNCKKQLFAPIYLSVHPSARTEQLSSHRTDFHKILYLNIFRKSTEKIQVSLKSNTNNGYFTLSSMNIYDNMLLYSS